MRRLAASALLVVSCFACKETGTAPDAGAPAEEKPVVLAPPPPIPPNPAFLAEVKSPPDNPISPEKVQLGQMLFFEKRLSKDNSMGCAECHHIDKAYTDGRAVSPKVGGGMNKRNAPSMANLGLHEHGYYWDGRKGTLEAVSDAAWTGQLGADPATVVAKLNANPTYRAHFQRAFGGPATAQSVTWALGSFFRALHSGDSAWDRFEKGDKAAASAEAQRGFEVFKSAGCALCHVPPLYSDTDYHNAGIGSDKPADKRDHGRMDATKDAKDDGKFKTPSLRDVARTAPYFHDGSAASLDAAIDVMLAGGVKNPGLDEKLKPQKLDAKDRAALKAFLEALSGKLSLAEAPKLPD
jgi:cytochrome c peroxidase